MHIWNTKKMRRIHFRSGVYFCLWAVIIYIVLFQGNKISLVSTIVGLMRPNSARIFQSKFVSNLNAPKTSKQSEVETEQLLPNHYLIYSKPDGRLGNWLFQCASGFGISNTLRYQFCIELSHPLNKYFDIKVLAEMECRNETWKLDKSYASYNLTPNGFLQSWKYLKNVSREVKNMLSFKQNILQTAKQNLEDIKNHSENILTVGIHVRRGDFQSRYHQTKGYTIACMTYISRAINFYRSKAVRTLFIVVSDDMKWRKDNINGSDVRYSHSKEAIVDLALLTLCDHIIIAGGSFGWRAGWLSGGTVVYLKDFPRPGSVLEKLTNNSKTDYYPPHWIGFNNN